MAGVQSGWKVFLNPGWIITIILVIAFSYSAFTILSPWQLNKDAQIVDRNEHIEQAFKVDPQPYSAVFDAQGKITDNQEWMRVNLSGRYLPEKEVILRLRPVESTPAVHALTPFQLDSGETILINRGFEPVTAGVEPTIPPAPNGEVTIIAHARVSESTPHQPPTTAQPIQVYGINTQQISELTGLNLAQDYAQLSDDQPGLLNYIPIPKLDRGNHLSYGFQWIAFGIMAPLGLGYFIWSEAKERRRAKREEAEMAATTSTSGAGPDPSTPEPELPAPPATLVTETKTEAEPQPATRSRSRYGNQHPNHYRRHS